MADEVLDAESAAGTPAGDATTETPAAPAEPSEWDDPEPLAEGQMQFDRDYVTKLRDREAKYRIRARELHETVDKFGGAERIERAIAMLDDASTEEGVTKLFIEAGQALGLGFKEMEALFDASDAATAEAAQAAAAAGPADDDVMTFAEAKKLIEEQVLNPQREAEERRVLATAQATVADALKDVAKEDHAAVLALGQPHIADGDFDPDHIRAAIRKGVEELANARTRDREEYLKQKLAELEATPGSTAGSGAPGAEGTPPPTNWEDAKKRARARIAAAQAAEAAAR